VRKTLARLLQSSPWGVHATRQQQQQQLVFSKHSASAVDLSNCKLSSAPEVLDKVAFQSLEDEVDELNLAGNLLSVIPELPLSFNGLRKLNLAGNKLTELLAEIGELRCLTELDVGCNSLAAVPPEIGNLTNLEGLNLMCNQLKEIPGEIGLLGRLVRLGLKGNLLQTLPAEIGDLKSLKELYLSDNRLVSLPAEMGELKELVKVQLSWNCLTGLPAEMGTLPNLELMRVAVNRIEAVPSSFAQLPKLTWFSLASNPASRQPPSTWPLANIQEMEYSSLPVLKEIGAGASGAVFLSEREGQTVAVKVFKSEVSPDGHAADEIGITVCLDHPNLTRVVGKAGSPLSLVLKHVDGAALADRPNSQSLLRCRWAAGLGFSFAWVVNVSYNVASALSYLHSKGICHGDVYAHNIIASNSGHAVLCDFGASFFYDEDTGHSLWEPMEVRGFGLLLSDLIDRLEGQRTLPEAELLYGLMSECVQSRPAARPSFEQVTERLKSLKPYTIKGAEL